MCSLPDFDSVEFPEGDEMANSGGIVSGAAFSDSDNSPVSGNGVVLRENSFSAALASW